MEIKKKHSQGWVSFWLLVSAILLLLITNFINNSKLSYVPRAAEITEGSDTRAMTGPQSNGTSGPVSTSSASFNCNKSINTCAEDIGCGYCRQHDTDCRMYLCVGPDYDRGEGRQTYAYSVYMPYPNCPKPAKIKSTCTSVVSWNETINKTQTEIEAEIGATKIKTLPDGSRVGLVPGLGYMLLN